MELRDYVRVLRRHWLLITAAVVLGIGSAGAFSFLQNPVYEATSKAFVSVNSVSTVQELNAGSDFVTQAVTSYANLATTDTVLNPVIKQLGLSTDAVSLAKEITVTTPINTVMIQIQVDDQSAKDSALIANAVATQLATAVDQITPTPAGGSNAVKVSKVDSAVVPTSPVSPRIPLNLALGLLIGLALGLAIAFLYSRLDNRVRGQRDVELITDRPILGGIGYDSRAKAEPLIVHADPRGPRAEAFRSLRTNLQFLDFGAGARTMVITSSVENEGKSTTAANLAIAVADTGQRVLLVEADLRKPKLGEYLGMDSAVGLTDVLVGNATLEQAVQQWGEGTMSVLPAGSMPPNPSELLQSNAMLVLIDLLKSRYDTVIFDAPPLLPVSDAAILARRTGGALMVAAAGRTSRPQLRAALNVLHQVEAKVLGLVVTMVPAKGADAYAYGHYGYSRSYAAAPVTVTEPRVASGAHRVGV